MYSPDPKSQIDERRAYRNIKMLKLIWGIVGIIFLPILGITQ